MKKSLLLIFLATIVLAGCSSSHNDNFQKKQECGNYESSMNSFLASKYPNADWIYVKYETLDAFYSSTLNSCLYWYKAFDRLCGINDGCSFASDYDTYVDFWIYDVLSKKEIFYKRTDSWQLVLESEWDYNTKVRELKWE